MIVAVPPDRIPLAWGGLIAILRPAVARDPQRTSWDLLSALMEDRMTAWLVEAPGVQGVIVTRIDYLEKPHRRRKVGWIYYAAGRVRRPSNARSVFRHALQEFEQVARSHGCREVRFGGRLGWSAIADGYQLLSQSGSVIEMKKVL